MFVFRNERFEIGLNLDTVKSDGIKELFRVMRECEDCSQYEADIATLEAEVWKKYGELTDSAA